MGRIQWVGSVLCQEASAPLSESCRQEPADGHATSSEAETEVSGDLGMQHSCFRELGLQRDMVPQSACPHLFISELED